MRVAPPIPGAHRFGTRAIQERGVGRSAGPPALGFGGRSAVLLQILDLGVGRSQTDPGATSPPSK